MKGNNLTRYGKLCCEPDSKKHGLQAAFINVSYFKVGPPRKFYWAQSGWGRERNAGAKAVNNDRYMEVMGVKHTLIRNPAAPADGTNHAYQFDLDNTTGTWTFLYDGAAFGVPNTIVDAAWVGIQGTGINAEGETHNSNDDLPGTAAAKCDLTNLQVKLGAAAYAKTAFVAGDIHNSQAAQWGVNLNAADSVSIWDKKPN